jgi:hypothetical protein
MMQRMMIAAVMTVTSATFAGTTECGLQQTAKLTADDGAESDYFGSSVAIDAGVAVIGAWSDDHDDNGTDSGSAYVYEQQEDGTWQQIAKLTADDGASNDEFGSSVDIDGDVAVIGAFGDGDNGDYSGSAYVYEQHADGTWQQIAKLTADDGASSDYFGYSVAIDAGVAVIGADGDDDNGSSSGSAYVYEQQAGGTWQQIAKLTADDGVANDLFGSSVALDAGVAVIGARYGEGDFSGSAYVYEQQADGTWQQVAKLTADDGASDDEFGYSVDIDGDVAVIGAIADDDNGAYSGSVYVYEQQADGTWPQTTKLTADDGAESDYFGSSVAIDAGVAVIGASGDFSGSAYVYEQQADGTWQQTAKLTADDGASGDYFGSSVATSDGVAVIGASSDGDFSGSAYVYEDVPTNTDCNGDVNCNQVVDVADLDVILSLWNQDVDGIDISGDGIIGIADLLMLLEAWGPCE